MTDDRFEELMADAAKSYRVPPAPDFEAMWGTIASSVEGRASKTDASFPATQLDGRRWTRFAPRLRIAAALVVGVGLGRASLMIGHKQEAAAVPTVASVASAPAAHADSGLGRPYEVETSQYLGQTAALLVSLPAEVKAGRADQQFTARAADLLARTRLLMDSPAGNDPAMRSLFEDLELVLAQVVRLQNNGNHLELDLINRALEQRDVIPRLRTAAADISAN
jgi:hypothetical protein